MNLKNKDAFEKVLPTYLRRRNTRITPCKPQAQLGVESRVAYPNSLGVELLSSSRQWRHSLTPSCASLARGYQCVSPFGDGGEQLN